MLGTPRKSNREFGPLLKPKVERAFHTLSVQCGPAVAQVHVDFVRCGVEIPIALAMDSASRLIIWVSSGSSAAKAVTDLVRNLSAFGYDFFHFCPDPRRYVDYEALAEEFQVDIAITPWRPKWVEKIVHEQSVMHESWVAEGCPAAPTIPHPAVA